MGLGVNAETHDRLMAVRLHGARAAFAEVPVVQQFVFDEVSLAEFSGYVCWSRERKVVEPVGPADIAEWDALDCEAKASWLPDDVIGLLAGDPSLVPLLHACASGCV